MAKLQWDDSLSIGVDLIDEQHKRWIEHYNSLVAAVETRQGPRKIAQTLGFLVDYTAFHFKAEEQQMTASDYPNIADHQTKHAALQADLARLVDDFQTAGSEGARRGQVRIVRDLDQRGGFVNARSRLGITSLAGCA